MRPLEPGGGSLNLPLVSAGLPSDEVGAWVQDRAGAFRELFAEHGAFLLRGFAHDEASSVRQVATTLTPETMDYRYGAGPRVQLGGNVYTSTELDPALTLPPHSELVYSTVFPRVVAFLCVRPASSGGQTQIADNRLVLDQIPARILRSFERGILYVRNYPADPSKTASWKRAFETEDRAEVEAFCAERGIESAWFLEDRLHTRQRTGAVGEHPDTGEAVWLNQAHIFHSSSLGRRAHLSTIDPRRALTLPRNALFGDGRRISVSTIRAIRRAFDRTTFMFDWRAGDVLVLDNMLFAHGRMPFTGDRRVVVAMAGPVGRAQDARVVTSPPLGSGKPTST